MFENFYSVKPGFLETYCNRIPFFHNFKNKSDIVAGLGPRTLYFNRPDLFRFFVERYCPLCLRDIEEQRRFKVQSYNEWKPARLAKLIVS